MNTSVATVSSTIGATKNNGHEHNPYSHTDSSESTAKDGTLTIDTNTP